LIWVIEFGDRSGRNQNEIHHPGHDHVAHNHCDDALNSALLAQALALLRLDEIRMFGFEIGLDAGSRVFKLYQKQMFSMVYTKKYAELLGRVTHLCLVGGGCR
jgi:hypothetical protein